MSSSSTLPPYLFDKAEEAAQEEKEDRESPWNLEFLRKTKGMLLVAQVVSSREYTKTSFFTCGVASRSIEADSSLLFPTNEWRPKEPNKTLFLSKISPKKQKKLCHQFLLNKPKGIIYFQYYFHLQFLEYQTVRFESYLS